MRSYFDHRYSSFGLKPPSGYVVRYDLSEDVERKKAEIDDILWNLSFNEIENNPGGKHFKDGALEVAREYVRTSWLHTPWLTSKALTQVLDSELVPLKKEALGKEVNGRFTSFLPGAYGVIVPAILSFLYFLALAAVGVSLFRNGHLLFATLVTVHMAWHFGQRLAVNMALRSSRMRLRRLCAPLQLIRDEVASGSYDSREIERRLRRSEADGLYVHSLTYALLKTATD
jgi:hypothetical protein